MRRARATALAAAGAGALVAALVAGCASVGRDYTAPLTAVPADWQTRSDETRQTIAPERWWEAFHDPGLDRLVARALTGNYDVRIAIARLREVRADLGVASAAQGPQVDASGAATRQRTLFFAPNGPVPATTTLYQVGFDATWELDLFGGTRRAVEAAQADLGAAVASRHDVQISVVAEVVRAWLALGSAQERLVIAQRALASEQDSRDLVAARVSGGLAAASALAQADAQLATNRTLLPGLLAARAQAANQLAVLLGEPPPALHELDAVGHRTVVAGLDNAPLFSAVAVPDPVDLLRPGLPSELLRRRPDIQRAERELAGATARVGVATADLYPRFSLTGSFGFEGLSTSGLFTSPNGIWSIGPTVRWPILASGRIAANIHAADAREEQALLRYRQTVLGAFADAENALVALLRERERAHAFALAVAAHQNALALAKERQAGGVDDYLAVLREELALFTVQDDWQLSRLAVADDLVALAKALGGGWQVDELEK